MAAPGVVLLVAGLALLTGAGNTYGQRVLFDTSCAAECGTNGSFNKPVFVTLVAFMAMAACCLPDVARTLWGCARRGCCRGEATRADGALDSRPDGTVYGGPAGPLSSLFPVSEDPDEPFLQADSESVKSATSAASAFRKRAAHQARAAWWCCCCCSPCCGRALGRLCRYSVLWVPAILDVLSTALSAATMLFISAAASATMRGSLLLFTLLFNRACRVRDGSAGRLEVLGVLVSSLGVVAVGVGAVLNESLPAAAAGSHAAAAGNSTAAAATPDAAALVRMLLQSAAAAANGSGLADGVASGAGAAAAAAPTASPALGSSMVLPHAMDGFGGAEGLAALSAGGAGGGLSPVASALVGIALAVAANLVMAAQVVYETARLEASQFTANEVNYVEGWMGAAICGAALGVFQGVSWGPDGGHIEDSASTLCCLRNTPALAYISGALFLLFAASTPLHMLLSQYRGSNFRSVVLVSRALLVWCVEFAAFYLPQRIGVANPQDDASRYGEPWERWSWVQALGFGVLACGAGLSWYGQSVREAGRRRRVATALEGGPNGEASGRANRRSFPASPQRGKDPVLVWRMPVPASASLNSGTARPGGLGGGGGDGYTQLLRGGGNVGGNRHLGAARGEW